MVKDENDFKDAFRTSASIDISARKKNGHQSARSMIGGPNRHFMDVAPQPSNTIDILLEASKTFTIGDKSYIFSEEDRIFFMVKPLS